MNLSVAGQTLVVPIYVNPTAGPATALGAYSLKICLPPWDVPVGTPGRAFEGAQLLDAKFTVNKIFTTPTGRRRAEVGDALHAVQPRQGHAQRSRRRSRRARSCRFRSASACMRRYVKKTNTWKLSGAANEGGLPVGGLTIKIARGLTAAALKLKSSVKTGAGGTWSAAGKLTPKKTTYFQVSASRR